MHRREFLITAGACALGAAGAVIGPSVRTSFNSTAVVAPTFDTYLTTYTQAFPIMRQRGLVGTFFVDPFNLNTPGCPSTSMLVEMKAAGWEIGAYSAHNMLALEQDVVIAYRQLRDLRSAMERHGFHVKSLAAMQRAWSQPLRNLARNVFENVRVSVDLEWQEVPITDRLYVNSGGTPSLSQSDTGETLCQQLEALAASKRIGFPVVHQVGADEDPSHSVAVDAFTAFCNCAERMIAAGQLRNMTFADAVRVG